MGQNLKHFKAETVSFRRKQNHDLAKLLRTMTKETDDVVKVLVELMKSQDEKIRLQAATKFLEIMSSVSKDISDDSIKRLLAEVKYGDNRNLVEDDEDDDGHASIDFTTVQEV